MGKNKVCRNCGQGELIGNLINYSTVCSNCGEQRDMYGTVIKEAVLKSSSTSGPSITFNGNENLKNPQEGGRARIMLEVIAGVVPGSPVHEYTRQYAVTDEDMNNPPRYIEICGMAMNYAMSLQNPGRVNWVKFEWLWL